MQNEYYMLTGKGRNQGEVLVALYKANRFLSVEELMVLSKQDKNTVMQFLAIFQKDGSVEQLADEAKWGIVPEVRAMLENMLLMNGWRL